VFGLEELLRNIGLYMLLGMRELISYKPVIITEQSHGKMALILRLNFSGKKSPNIKLQQTGESILVSVENITPFGIWLFVKRKEYFLSYRDYPYFRDQTLKSIQTVQLLHDYHLYWPELDVALEIANLENPEKYPLKCKTTKSYLTIQSIGSAKKLASR
jgi:hypothetical protein